MKKIISVVLVLVGLTAIAFMSKATIAAGESGSVAAAAQCSFAAAADFQSVALSGIDVGTGVLIGPDGTAFGPFNAVLQGRSLLGQPQQITIDGSALQGAIAPDGRAYFSGLATIYLGNGTPALAGVPFSVTTTGDSILLSLGGTTLPAAQVTAGSISVE